MNHLDLFSGIGGFALAVDRVWPSSTHTFCDNDLFCQEILKKHWPDSKIYGDIRQITTNPTSERFSTSSSNREERHLLHNKDGVSEEDKSERNRRECGSIKTSPVDILTGGFPCQPFSQAGRRRGTEDDRYLWPEMFRVIQLAKPTWIIAENVGGLVTWNEGMVLEQVCLDLESEGYEVQPFIIPAVAVNAPHRRDRVWIIANRPGIYGERSKSKGNRAKRSERENRNESWSKNWIEVATELCGVFNGLPKRLDRTPRLKALGNAIVPQVAEEIMKHILL